MFGWVGIASRPVNAAQAISASGRDRAADLDDLYSLLERPAWHTEAACRHTKPDVFFPERGADGTTARTICARCPVVDRCLLDGLDERHGVWGGTSPADRKDLRRARRAMVA